MKRRILALTVLCSLLFCAPLFAGSGNDIGNGTDQIPFEADSAWFIGPNRVIEVCHEIGADFVVPIQGVREAISKAFAVWGDYLDRKSLKTTNLVTRVSFKEKCDGTEDLRFLFGTDTPESRQAKAKLVNPVAFNTVLSRDVRGGWAKGIVWVNSGRDFWEAGVGIDWTDSRNLLGILLHEAGHILGCSHAPDTIMDPERLLRMLKVPSDSLSPEKTGLAAIDGKLELYVCKSCPFEYSGVVAHRLTREDSDPGALREAAWLYELFSGKAPIGPVRGSIQGAQFSGTVTLTLTDGLSTQAIPILLGDNPYFFSAPEFTNTFRDGVLFKIVREPNSCRGGSCSLAKSEATIAYASARIANGETIPVVVERNISHWFIRGPMTVKLLYKGNAVNLFTAVVGY